MKDNSSSLEEEAVQIVEGRTILLVPKSSLSEKPPPRTPAFYNPYARLNRDLSILIYRATGKLLPKPVAMADSLAGVGARGVRVANEAFEVDEVYLNDLNPIAVKYSEASAKANRVYSGCRFSVKDICHFLIEHSGPKERFSIVDIDPFGSPAPYLDCGLKAVRDEGVVSVTATDTAVLCGVYPKVSFRKYFGRSIRTEYSHEVAVRLLLGALAYSAIKLDSGITPIFSHVSRNYVRVYVKVSIGAHEAEETVENMGYIHHCFKCGSRLWGKKCEEACESCGSSMSRAGPLWLRLLHDAEVLKACFPLSAEMDMKSCIPVLKLAFEETDMPPTYYVTDKVADKLQIPAPSVLKVVQELRDLGFKASRTVFNTKGVKTDAPVAVVEQVVGRLA